MSKPRSGLDEKPNESSRFDKSFFRSFGWESASVDGHDGAAIVDLVSGRTGDRPYLLVARTIKGKGVSYMENTPIWHYRSPDKAEYLQAVAELGG